MSSSSLKAVVPKIYKEHPFDLHGLDGISDKATERGTYIEAFFRNIDWRMVEGRLPEKSALRLAS